MKRKRIYYFLFVNKKRKKEIRSLYFQIELIYLMVVVYLIKIMPIKRRKRKDCMQHQHTKKNYEIEKKNKNKGIVTYLEWLIQLLESTSSSHDSSCMHLFYFLLFGIILKSGIDRNKNLFTLKRLNI
jgi:hypothetical protein